MLGTCNLALEKFWNVEAHLHWSSQDSPRLHDLAVKQLLRCCTTDVLPICFNTFVVGFVIGTHMADNDMYSLEYSSSRFEEW